MWNNAGSTNSQISIKKQKQIQTHTKYLNNLIYSLEGDNTVLNIRSFNSTVFNGLLVSLSLILNILKEKNVQNQSIKHFL
jgi:hypothetical protein